MDFACDKAIRESTYVIEAGFSVFKGFPDGFLQFHSIKIIPVSKDIDIIKVLVSALAPFNESRNAKEPDCLCL